MGLFDRDRRQRLSLLDIYVPIPVDFTLEAEVDDAGEIREWRVAWGRGSEEGQEREFDGPDELPAADIAEAGFWTRIFRPRREGGVNPEADARQQWPEMALDGPSLQPLLGPMAEAIRAGQAAEVGPQRRQDGLNRFRWSPDPSTLIPLRPNIPDAQPSTGGRELVRGHGILRLVERGAVTGDRAAVGGRVGAGCTPHRRPPLPVGQPK